jgi:hypothetical protein
MFRLLATASSDATKIVEEGALASSTIAQSFDQMWADVINSGGGLYGAISNLGMLFAVGTFVWWAVSFAKALIHDDYIKPAEDIIWVIVVGILLANQGQLLAQSTLGLRGIINQTNQAVLNSTSNSFRLQDAYKQIMQETGKQDVAQGLLSQCASIVDTEQQKACIDNAKAQSQQVAGNGQSPSSGFQKFLNNVGGILQANLFVVAGAGLVNELWNCFSMGDRNVSLAYRASCSSGCWSFLASSGCKSNLCLVDRFLCCWHDKAEFQYNLRLDCNDGSELW